MHSGHYVFAQITKFLPKRFFERLTVKYDDRTRGWSLSHWNHLLDLMFGQLLGCRSLRELTDITVAHANKSFFLGFGKGCINRQIRSKANAIRDYRIFEEFAFHMVAIAQSKRITREFELHGRFYAVDSTTIDLCLSVFRWAKFRTSKSGIRIHTQIDIVTEIPVFYRITNAQVHDVNSMDWFTYEPLACYVFDRGNFDLARLYKINSSGAFFIIREKFHPAYEIESGFDFEEKGDNVLRDQTVRFTGKRNKTNYPTSIRRIVYYSPELRRTFTYYTNNFHLEAKNIALLYKNRWQVELFFKWIKQHLRVKTFWGECENAVRVQIHVAIITYCLIGIVEHDMQINRPIVEVMRILGSSLLTKDDAKDLLAPFKQTLEKQDDRQLSFDFHFD
ncbi:MAG: IS4 family transposase [Paludibacteraceae bacterium]|nr:IS4 family transposase [Paludibacteraceae bacterium]